MVTDSGILSRLVKNLQSTEKDPLTPLIDAYLLKRDASPTRYREAKIPVVPPARHPGRLSPSAIGGCQRKAVFTFMGVPGARRLDPELELKFDDGNWRHHRWQAMFRDMEAVLGPEVFRVLSVEEEVEYRPLRIAGRLDSAIAIHGTEYIVDFKGINDRGFSWVYNNNAPAEEHVSQLLSYMRCRGNMNGMIIYDNKNDQRTKVFIVTFTPEKWEELRTWCKRVLRYLKWKEELPPRHIECEAGSFLWDKCPFAHLCFGTKTEPQVERLAYHTPRDR